MHNAVVLDPDDMKTLVNGGRVTVRGVTGDLEIMLAQVLKFHGRRPKAIIEMMGPATNGASAPSEGGPAHAYKKKTTYDCTCGLAFQTPTRRAAHIGNRTRAGEKNHGIPANDVRALAMKASPYRCICGMRALNGTGLSAHLRIRKKHPDDKKHGDARKS